MSVPIHRLDDLAETCVFSKQSPRPFLCGPVQLLPRGDLPVRAPLLPKLRGHFAEFLNKGSLEHLRILSSPTCVGLRYGRRVGSLRGFSRQSDYDQFMSKGLPIAPRSMSSRICLRGPPTCLDRDNQRPAGLHYCVTPSVKRLTVGTGILTRFPSPTPFDLGLGAD